MAYPKRVALQIYKIEDSAIKLYEEGLIMTFKRFVPKQYSYVEVLKGCSESGEKIDWLQKMFKKICDFAEEARLKQIPQKLEGGDPDKPIQVSVVIEKNENSITPESGNRISQFIEV